MIEQEPYQLNASARDGSDQRQHGCGRIHISSRLEQARSLRQVTALQCMDKLQLGIGLSGRLSSPLALLKFRKLRRRLWRFSRPKPGQAQILGPLPLSDMAKVRK